MSSGQWAKYFASTSSASAVYKSAPRPVSAFFLSIPPPTIVRFLFSTPYLFDREKKCWGFGGCSAPASEFLSPT
eukprot:scaffold69980_cov79-Cyclotella_meneghiniana.AAC.1